MAHLVKPHQWPDRPQGHQNFEEDDSWETQDTPFKYLSVYSDENEIGDVGARHLSDADFPELVEYHLCKSR